jgi:hypothetical protein
MKKISISDKIAIAGLLITLCGGAIGVGKIIQKQNDMAARIEKLDDRLVEIEAEAFTGFTDVYKGQDEMKARLDLIQKLRKDVEMEKGNSK